MKKLMTIAAVALIFATGCNKIEDGYYNPNKKINQIIQCETDTAGTVVDTSYHVGFVWDGDLLTQIKDLENNGIIEKYFYDSDNRLIKTEGVFFIVDVNSYYEYDGNKLKTMYMVDGDNSDTILRYEFVYRGTTLKQIKLIVESDESEKADLLMAYMGIILPPEMAYAVTMSKNELNVSPDKGEEQTQTYDLEWKNGNLIQISAKGEVQDEDSVTYEKTIIFKYNFDDYENPIRGMYPLGGLNFHNKNNCTRFEYTEISKRDGMTQTQTYAANYKYQYENQLPVAKKLLSGEDAGIENLFFTMQLAGGLSSMFFAGPYEENKIIYYKYEE